MDPYGPNAVNLGRVVGDGEHCGGNGETVISGLTISRDTKEWKSRQMTSVRPILEAADSLVKGNAHKKSRGNTPVTALFCSAIGPTSRLLTETRTSLPKGD